LIDLHTHTNESDGTLEPVELIREAIRVGLDALGITDHDTFAGYDRALPVARTDGLDLVCGIELSTKDDGQTVHLLGYFLSGSPGAVIRERMNEIQRSRRERNERLVARLNGLGLDITFDEVRAVGRGMTGRPHFARVLVRKGYAATIQEAFERYIGEGAPGFVERDSITLNEAIRLVADSGGLPVLAHPIRLRSRDAEAEDARIARMREIGLGGIEVYHSDHAPPDVLRYRILASKYGLAITGGSDFHGDTKPHVLLGSGRAGNVSVPLEVLSRLRAQAAI
jgi:3',5'-nucleoside bisphosphate phosphatase